MSLILNIDTATETAHVSIARDGIVLKDSHNASQKDHASFLQPAIRQITIEAAVALKDIDAIAVTAGPGSYTGLRVGLASAKGLCYALNKPLIMLNTLEVLTASALYQQRDKAANGSTLFCPMIDARRMEVFTAIYNEQLVMILPPQAMVLEEQSFKEQLEKHKLLFFGSGAAKWIAICHHPNTFFDTVSILPEAMSQLSYLSLSRQQLADLAYSEPFYLKEFQIVIKK